MDEAKTMILLLGTMFGAFLVGSVFCCQDLLGQPSIVACRTLAASEGRYGAYANPGYGNEEVCIVGDIRELPTPRMMAERSGGK